MTFVVGLFALALRLVPWLANLPLHHDEALYGAWARAIADGSDPLLLIPWVDKPPLVLYLLAGSLKLFGASELALRAPGMLASLLTVWATHGLARRLYGEKAALIAAALFALSPFAILFGPTAFTDPWLTLFLVAAAWAAVARQPLWAGALVGLAAASKQQGVFAAPLALALVVLAALDARPPRRARAVLTAVGLAALGFGMIFGLVTYWDSLRWHNRPSYWDQSLRTYGGVTLVALAEWPRRAREWAGQVALLFGAWWLTLPVLATAAASFVAQGTQVRRLAPHPGALVAQVAKLAPPQRGLQVRRLAPHPGALVAQVAKLAPQRAPQVIGAYSVGYLVVHIAFTFQPWDRYLLPILPLICVLAADGLLRIVRRARGAEIPPAARTAATAAAVGAAIYAASLGVTAAIPAGSDVGAYEGVAQAAAFLARQPGRPTVYHDHLGWHLDYYLYGLPVARSWFDSPQKLASEAGRVAREQPDAAQWLALPGWEAPELPALAAALRAAGFAAEPDVTIVAADGATVDLTLYRLIPIARELAAMPDQDAAP